MEIENKHNADEIRELRRELDYLAGILKPYLNDRT